MISSGTYLAEGEGMMTNYVDCPYCGTTAAITNDDTHEEDHVYAQECRSCDKVFAFAVQIVAQYRATRADCLNGAPHKFVQTSPTTKSCFTCHREEDLDP